MMIQRTVRSGNGTAMRTLTKKKSVPLWCQNIQYGFSPGKNSKKSLNPLKYRVSVDHVAIFLRSNGLALAYLVGDNRGSRSWSANGLCNPLRVVQRNCDEFCAARERAKKSSWSQYGPHHRALSDLDPAIQSISDTAGGCRWNPAFLRPFPRRTKFVAVFSLYNPGVGCTVHLLTSFWILYCLRLSTPRNHTPEEISNMGQRIPGNFSGFQGFFEFFQVRSHIGCLASQRYWFFFGQGPHSAVHSLIDSTGSSWSSIE